MIGRINPNQPKVAVIGGGISGLLAAYRLDQLGYEVSLYEASSRLGGLISTHTLRHGIAESAAHSLLASAEVLRLLTELQVEFVTVNKGKNARFILRDRKLRRFPLSPVEAMAALSRFMTRKSRASGRKASDPVLLSDWSRNFLGAAARDYLVAPFVTGVYGCQPDELDVRAAFPKLIVPEGQTLLSHLKKLRRSRSANGKKPMIAPARGMGSFVEALEKRVREKLGSRIYLNHKLADLPNDMNIVLCVPAAEAARLLSSSDANSARALQFVRYAPLASCTIILRRDSHQPPEGIGFLVPPREDLSILGVLFNSSAFPGRVHDESRYASYTVMMGGTVSPHWVSADEAEIRRTIELQLQALFGLKGGAEEIRISKWPNAVPIYGPELSNAWEMLRSGWCRNAGHVFFGNASGQVSLRGMIEEIYSWSDPSALIQSG